MEYRQSFDRESLLKLNMDEALDSIRAELAENLLNINNHYCATKFSVIADVFVNFPASDEYDHIIDEIIPVGKEIVTLSYGLEGLNEGFKSEFLKRFLDKREELKRLMKFI